MIKQISLGKNNISALKKGDTVAVISTARKVSPEELDFAITKIKSWGLNVCFGNNLFKKHHQFAGTIQERADDLQWALDDNNIKAVSLPEVVMVPFMLLIMLIGKSLKQIQNGSLGSATLLFFIRTFTNVLTPLHFMRQCPSLTLKIQMGL